MRTTSDPGSVLFGRVRRLVLGWLYSHPDGAFYLRQIARQTGLPVGSIQGELDQLLAAGIVTRTVQGRQVYFQADAQSPIFQELQALLTKTGGIADIVRDALLPLSSRIQVALIFGSAARNELRNNSDIDLLIVGDLSLGEVVGELSDAQRILGREVNPTVYSAEEFRRKVLGRHHFLTAVLQKPYILLMGDRNELERLGAAEQVADQPHGHEKRNHRAARGRRSRSAG